LTADRERGGAVPVPGPETLSPVPSPCNSVCRMDAEGLYCIGCFRTLDEIAGWGGFDDGQRRSIWDTLRRRKALNDSLVKNADDSGAV
jgi:uncharacterized protein